MSRKVEIFVEKLLLFYLGAILFALVMGIVYYIWLKKVNKDNFNLIDKKENSTNKDRRHNNFKIVNRR